MERQELMAELAEVILGRILKAKYVVYSEGDGRFGVMTSYATRRVMVLRSHAKARRAAAILNKLAGKK